MRAIRVIWQTPELHETASIVQLFSAAQLAYRLIIARRRNADEANLRLGPDIAERDIQKA